MPGTRALQDAAAEPLELLEVTSAEPDQLVGSDSGDGEAYDAMVVGITGAAEVAGLDRAVDQAGCAVVSQHQRLGNIADGRCVRAGVPADGEEELMLRGSEPFTLGLLFAPVEEPPQLRAELEQSSVVRVRELSLGHRI
jgi:hypothetical protein